MGSPVDHRQRPDQIEFTEVTKNNHIQLIISQVGFRGNMHTPAEVPPVGDDDTEDTGRFNLVPHRNGNGFILVAYQSSEQTSQIGNRAIKEFGHTLGGLCGSGVKADSGGINKKAP